MNDLALQKQIAMMKSFFLAVLFAWIILAAGCAESPPTLPPVAPTSTITPPSTSTPVPSPIVLPSPTATLIPPTATSVPSATPLPTIAPTFTATAQPESLSAWCMPAGMLVNVANTSGTPPKEAKLGVVSGKNTLRIPAPASSCTFVYRFSQPLPAGSELQVFDLSSSPWMKVKLQPLSGNPAVVVVVMTHEYIINPPFWSISYRFVVRDGSGVEKRSDTIEIVKPLPAKCPLGGYPHPVTLQCPRSDPKEPEPHPDFLEYFDFWK